MTLLHALFVGALLICFTVAVNDDIAYHAWRAAHQITTPASATERFWFLKARDAIQALVLDSPHATFHLPSTAGDSWGIQARTVSATAQLTAKTFNNSQIQTALSSSKDWQMTQASASLGAVTRIKNQGQCGACWAFGVVAAVEAMYKIKGRDLSAFSEQYILDCLPPTPGLNGCNSGDIGVLAQTLALGSYKLPLERNYEYLAFDNTTHTCNQTAASTGVGKVSAAWSIGTVNTQTIEDAMAAWVYFNGPVVVGVSSAQPAWQLYQSGIADCPSVQKSQLDHAVTIVGYGTQNINGESVPYWKVKNSWTPKWGDNGYIYLRRGTNACGIQWIPTVVDVQ